jgi:hypothetical protein
MIALQVLFLAAPWMETPSAAASSPARFGFAESGGASGERAEFRLEMELSPAASSHPDSDEALYATLKSIYAAHSSEGSEGSLTDSEFTSLASEKVGDVYTLVAGNAVFVGRVTGGTIRLDPQFSELYRLYLRIGIPEDHAPLREGRVEMIGLRGEHAVSAVRSFVLAADAGSEPSWPSRRDFGRCRSSRPMALPSSNSTNTVMPAAKPGPSSSVTSSRSTGGSALPRRSATAAPTHCVTGCLCRADAADSPEWQRRASACRFTGC